MDDDAWLDEYPLLWRMAPADAAKRLRAADEKEVADLVESAGERKTEAGEFFGLGDLIRGSVRPWQHSSHAFGFLPRERNGVNRLSIQPAGAIRPDRSLMGQRISVTLDRLFVSQYPGRGTHQVLFDFHGRHTTPRSSEGVHFALTLRVRDGEDAAVTGLPIFVGLRVGDEGVAFRGYTLCLTSEDDEALISFLDSDAFKAGLHLTATVQPAVGLVSSMVVGLTKALAQRNQNVPIQHFDLGLDFTGIATRAALAEGSYIAVQVPGDQARSWAWDDWVFDIGASSVVAAEDPSERLPYNYMIFSVSRYGRTDE